MRTNRATPRAGRRRDPVRTHPRARRGFTLLEVALASALGALVAAGAVAMIAAIGRADRQQAERSLSSLELERTHRAMQTVFNSLHMATGATAVGAPVGAERPDEPPRISLAPDRALLRAMQRSGGVQRLEVVVNRPPLPGIDALAADWARRRAVEAAAASSARGWRDPGEVELIGVRTPRRIAFELRPEPRAPDARPDDPSTWTLWYRPVGVSAATELDATGAALGGDAPPEDLDPAAAALLGAYPLVTGLVLCEWRVFTNRERVTEFEAWQANELPAFIEMELRTASGTYANWLFEVGWLSGEERRTPDEAPNGLNPNGANPGGGGGGEGRGVTPPAQPGGGGQT
ncbi:MAG: prepilin-type N-terminal cleavage/methylation domain-containing protein [Phycisphaerales bacterium]|nr:MAG: prepilin-type N-terminal cleavage/methylation domain-containing protein [Phycisphaerales bacterium]